MSHHPRRILTPGASRKRKEMEALYTVRPSTPTPQPPAPAAAEPVSSNSLLAGYMAYEFLTKGTLFGQKWDPGRAEAVPLSSAASAESKRTKPSHKAEAEPVTRAAPSKQHQSYAEVARLLKSDGAHIPGIVNPTQLARWIQM